MEKLFDEFEPVSAAQWKQQILKDLKGAPYENLVWKNPNGFGVEPFYTAEDITESAPVFTHTGWGITEEIVVQDEKSANARALRALQGGAGALHFVLTRKADLSALLSGISISHIEVCFILRYAEKDFRESLHSYLEHSKIDGADLRGGICFDAIGRLAESGDWYHSEETDLAWQNSWINAWLYQNAGATQSFELACALAHGHEYLLRAGQPRTFRFSLSVGADFFGEIAKLRALRQLWRLVAEPYKASPHIHIHACSAHLNQSQLDAYNNMLRTSTGGMSAVLGGCNSLTLEAYDKTFARANEFGERIARNQQLILGEESYLGRVADAGAGSYYIETLTDNLAEKAWEEFKAIEARGGFIACLRSDYIQNAIKQQAEQLISQFREEKLVLVGVNKFRNKEEAFKRRPDIKRIARGAEVTPLAKISLSDYLVKENA